MLQLLAANKSLNSICIELHMSKKTVQVYKKAAQSTGTSFLELSRLTDEQLMSILKLSPQASSIDPRKVILEGMHAVKHVLDIKPQHNTFARPVLCPYWERYIFS